MIKCFLTVLIVIALLSVVGSCSSKNPAPSAVSPSPQYLLKTDVPALPVLSYTIISNAEWELKRLGLSQNGFEVLNECGTVYFEDGRFHLDVDLESYYRPSYLEEKDEYLQKTFWEGLDGILSSLIFSNNGSTVLGFLEYYGFYYLAVDTGLSFELYSLGETPSFDESMPLKEFCSKAWEYFCYVENASETVYGGNGITIP